RTSTTLICSTHLNADGKPLGRRILGQGRVVIKMTCPDPDGQPKRRKLCVIKSNQLWPAALGITMGDAGNDYDDRPPEEPAWLEAKRPGKPTKVDEAEAWLAKHLESGEKRVSSARTEAEAKGFSPGTLYAAKDRLGVEEYVSGGKMWWRLGADGALRDV